MLPTPTKNIAVLLVAFAACPSKKCLDCIDAISKGSRGEENRCTYLVCLKVVLQLLASVATASVCSTQRLRGKAKYNISKGSISIKIKQQFCIYIFRSEILLKIKAFIL